MSDDWPDAYREITPSSGYLRVVPRMHTCEPIDDYTLEEFDQWLNLYSSYLTAVKAMQIANGVGYYGTTAYKESISPKRTTSVWRAAGRYHSKRRK